MKTDHATKLPIFASPSALCLLLASNLCASWLTLLDRLVCSTVTATRTRSSSTNGAKRRPRRSKSSALPTLRSRPTPVRGPLRLSLSLSLTPLSLLIEETIELIRIDGRWARRDGALVLRCGTARPRGVYPERDPRHHHHRCLNIPRLVEAWKLKRRRELDLAQLQN